MGAKLHKISLDRGLEEQVDLYGRRSSYRDLLDLRSLPCVK